jgi:hypothetical protein
MGLTALITADMGSVPLFWVAPLGLYLLTFVIAFGAKRRSEHRTLSLLQVLCVAAQIFMYVQNNGMLVPSWLHALLPFSAFVLTALLCHSRLADARPTSSALTEFYLWLALGGALGGVFNAFIAPVLFSYPFEFVLVLCSSVIFAYRPISIGFAHRMKLPIATVVLGVILLRILVPTTFLATIMSVVAFFCLWFLCKFPRQLGWVGVATTFLLMSSVMADAQIYLIHNFFDSKLEAPNKKIASARNFFGVVSVTDRRNAEGDVWRIMAHGSIIQGIERMTPTPDHKPKMNFEALQTLFAAKPFTQIGVVGLGAGMVVCFNLPDRHFTIYEIDTLVQEHAMHDFTYIKDCGEPRWRIGDGRIELQRDIDVRYDMIMIDAFSSGSIPTHLLTREALDVYRSRLQPDGIIVLNINNRYYDFYEPLAALAQDAGWQSWQLISGIDDIFHGKAGGHWALLAPGGQDMEYLKPMGWQKMPATLFPVWHDDHANILGAMRLFYHAKTH